MPHSTAATPGGVVLDWRHGRTGPLAPCVLCGLPALCRSPVRDVPCHKGCAETWISRHATGPRDLRRLIRACTPRSGGAR